MPDKKTVGSTLWRYRNLFFIILPPLLALPLPLVVDGQESQCGYIMIIMAIYWCTECLPLAVTAMIPIFMMPLMGLVKGDTIVVLYMQETTMMFTGGLMVALAIEKCNLHKRIALGILMLVGVKPIWLMMGFIMPTWFLSMWISNTATTSMMLPILEAVLEKLGDVALPKTRDTEEPVSQGVVGDDIPMTEIHVNVAFDEREEDEAGSSTSSNPSNHQTTEEEKPPLAVNGDAINGDVLNNKTVLHEIHPSHVSEPKNKSFRVSSKTNLLAMQVNPNVSSPDLLDSVDTRTPEQIERDVNIYRKMCKGMTLAVAYAANIGGTGTLTGTTPNIIMKDAADSLWRENGFTESPVNFASYMVFSTPCAFITIIIVWLYLVLFWLGPRGFKCGSGDTASEEKVKADIKEEFKSLGSMTYAEWWVLVVFSGMVFLWFFRSPGFMEGWGDSGGLQPGYVKDSVVSMMCVVALFIFPYHRPRCGSEKELGKVDTLLDWEIIHHKFPWSVIYLVGGGMALAEACVSSGLSDIIGDALTVFDALPLWFMTFVLALITSLLTEVTSNTATCTLIMPIVSTMAENMNLNPLYLMFPCAVATSFAFMLPVATPPNAIAFSYNRVTVLDMVKTGAVLKLTIFIITLATETWGMAYFDFMTPPWDYNTTTPNITSSPHYAMLKTLLKPQMTSPD